MLIWEWGNRIQENAAEKKLHFLPTSSIETVAEDDSLPSSWF